MSVSLMRRLAQKPCIPYHAVSYWIKLRCIILVELLSVGS